VAVPAVAVVDTAAVAGRGGTGWSGADSSREARRSSSIAASASCKFCVEKLEYIDYKDVKMLQQFIPERGKILPRRIFRYVRACISASCRTRSSARADRRAAAVRKPTNSNDRESRTERAGDDAGNRPSGKLVRSVAAYSLLAVAMLVTPAVRVPAGGAFSIARIATESALRGAVVFAAAIAGGFIAVKASVLPPVGPQDLQRNVTELLEFILGLGLPALIVIPMVQRNESFGRVLTLATLLSAVGMFGTEAIMAHDHGILAVCVADSGSAREQ